MRRPKGRNLLLPSAFIPINAAGAEPPPYDGNPKMPGFVGAEGKPGKSDGPQGRGAIAFIVVRFAVAHALVKAHTFGSLSASPKGPQGPCPPPVPCEAGA